MKGMFSPSGTPIRPPTREYARDQPSEWLGGGGMWAPSHEPMRMLFRPPMACHNPHAEKGVRRCCACPMELPGLSSRISPAHICGYTCAETQGRPPCKFPRSHALSTRSGRVFAHTGGTHALFSTPRAPKKNGCASFYG